ncbi:vitamin K epoxide reductase family protein [Segetibacter koreensis]|uniref:vitamin K epoxide reductase family protein n=1 Tax=Segetibacter koreensis TaxID=398037 RepID=UPI00036685C3|nr:vitamin K epoxide reductase family protein [Segetibacter koreensis]
MERTKQIPPGWDYNPSTLQQRLPLVLVALLGFCIAIYLSLFQLKIIHSVWDPFFGSGTEKVLTSPISKLLPVPDALLGAFGYIVDAVSGIVGGPERWKTKPWIVIVFGVAVGPLGLVSILLVISQPVLFNAWCTLCLCSAVISVCMISPAMDEMLASLQFLQRVKRSGNPVWKAFLGDQKIISTVP